MLDRFDIRIYTAPVSFEDMFSNKERLEDVSNEDEFVGNISDFTSEKMREHVCRAREIQEKRFRNSGHTFNSEMTESEVKEFCALNDNELTFLEAVYKRLRLTARGCNKILKTARTVADVSGSDEIKRAHIAVAVGFRNNEHLNKITL